MPSPAAKLVATAIARTGVYYKRSGIFSAAIALVGCIGVLLIEDTVPKAVLLASAVFFAVTAWRTIKTANRYFDPDGSPVLHAILRDQEHIVRIRSEPSDKRGGPMLVVEDDHGERLELRVSESDTQRELSALFDAFAELAPQAELVRHGE